MKISCALVLSTLASTSAFAPSTFGRKNVALNSVVTGPDGKAASSKEEDLALTLQVIMAHDARSVTVTAEQFASQMTEAAKVEDVADIDISIPYDAAAKLAYEASDKSMAFADFKTKYEADAVELVKSKKSA